MPKFESHITCPRDRADDVEAVGSIRGWKFSKIDGDPLLGKQPYAYLTNYNEDAMTLFADMKATSHALNDRKVPVLREKIEEIIYDTKTGHNELGVRFNLTGRYIKDVTGQVHPVVD